MPTAGTRCARCHKLIGGRPIVIDGRPYGPECAGKALSRIQGEGKEP